MPHVSHAPARSSAGCLARREHVTATDAKLHPLEGSRLQGHNGALRYGALRYGALRYGALRYGFLRYGALRGMGA
eukprot:3099178-Rhodomonas_salina.2